MQNTKELKEELNNLKVKEPKLRTRDLANRLGISELELVSLSVGESVTRLEGDWKELLVDLKEVGHVMALTRNEHCVHERKGVYDNIKFYGGPHNMGVAVNPDIDLRFLMNEWKYALAVTMDRGAGKKLYGFQFYNKRGEAIHKVYTTPKSNLAAYHILVDRYAAKEQSPILSVDRSPISEKEMVADESIDIAGFQEGWKNLKDTHDFFGLLRKYNVRRDQGLRLAPANFTCKVDNKTIVKVLEEAALIEVPIMCFVHSKGCIQIHTGAIKNLKSYGDWYNILDEEFNLHLDLPKVDQTWIVKKPTVDGIVTSIELFDKNGALITYFFGARKPGKPELKAWTSIMENQLLVEK